MILANVLGKDVISTTGTQMRRRRWHEADQNPGHNRYGRQKCFSTFTKRVPFPILIIIKFLKEIHSVNCNRSGPKKGRIRHQVATSFSKRNYFWFTHTEILNVEFLKLFSVLRSSLIGCNPWGWTPDIFSDSDFILVQQQNPSTRAVVFSQFIQEKLGILGVNFEVRPMKVRLHIKGSVAIFFCPSFSFSYIYLLWGIGGKNWTCQDCIPGRKVGAEIVIFRSGPQPKIVDLCLERNQEKGRKLLVRRNGTALTFQHCELQKGGPLIRQRLWTWRDLPFVRLQAETLPLVSNMTDQTDSAAPFVSWCFCLVLSRPCCLNKRSGLFESRYPTNRTAASQSTANHASIVHVTTRLKHGWWCGLDGGTAPLSHLFFSWHMQESVQKAEVCSFTLFLSCFWQLLSLSLSPCFDSLRLSSQKKNSQGKNGPASQAIQHCILCN